MDNDFESLEERVGKLEERMDDLEKAIAGLRGNLAAVFTKIFWGDENWPGIPAQMEKFDRIVELLEELVESNKESGQD